MKHRARNRRNLPIRVLPTVLPPLPSTEAEEDPPEMGPDPNLASDVAHNTEQRNGHPNGSGPRTDSNTYGKKQPQASNVVF